MGPFLQYATEKPANPIELRIYPGADARFTLYEDENDNYNYEKGIYSTVDFVWNDAKHLLTIADCAGEFPGMLKERIMNVVLVDHNHGIGMNITDRFDKVVNYNGKKVTVEVR
jgi:alpha-D-xyloside xylohydrolase